MPGINFTGGRRNAARVRLRDVAGRQQRDHFGRQRIAGQTALFQKLKLPTREEDSERSVISLAHAHEFQIPRRSQGITLELSEPTRLRPTFRIPSAPDTNQSTSLHSLSSTEKGSRLLDALNGDEDNPHNIERIRASLLVDELDLIGLDIWSKLLGQPPHQIVSSHISNSSTRADDSGIVNTATICNAPTHSIWPIVHDPTIGHSRHKTLDLHSKAVQPSLSRSSSVLNSSPILSFSSDHVAGSSCASPARSDDIQTHTHSVLDAGFCDPVDVTYPPVAGFFGLPERAGVDMRVFATLASAPWLMQQDPAEVDGSAYGHGRNLTEHHDPNDWLLEGRAEPFNVLQKLPLSSPSFLDLDYHNTADSFSARSGCDDEAPDRPRYRVQRPEHPALSSSDGAYSGWASTHIYIDSPSARLTPSDLSSDISRPRNTLSVSADSTRQRQFSPTPHTDMKLDEPRVTSPTGRFFASDYDSRSVTAMSTGTALDDITSGMVFSHKPSAPPSVISRLTPTKMRDNLAAQHESPRSDNEFPKEMFFTLRKAPMRSPEAVSKTNNLAQLEEFKDNDRSFSTMLSTNGHGHSAGHAADSISIIVEDQRMDAPAMSGSQTIPFFDEPMEDPLEKCTLQEEDQSMAISEPASHVTFFDMPMEDPLDAEDSGPAEIDLGMRTGAFWDDE